MPALARRRFNIFFAWLRLTSQATLEEAAQPYQPLSFHPPPPLRAPGGGVRRTGQAFPSLPRLKRQRDGKGRNFNLINIPNLYENISVIDMVMAIGLSQYNVALFHTVNHAFFKALLFLGAGAVIHSFGDQ